jgi:hypothetical protein
MGNRSSLTDTEFRLSRPGRRASVEGGRTGGRSLGATRNESRMHDMTTDELKDAVIGLTHTQGETNTRLERIERTLETSSRLFELMHERLVHLEDGQQALVKGQQALVEGQHALVEGQHALVEGQKSVIERLDHLVRATIQERTQMAERMGALGERVRRLEEHVFPEGAPGSG